MGCGSSKPRSGVVSPTTGAAGSPVVKDQQPHHQTSLPNPSTSSSSPTNKVHPTAEEDRDASPRETPTVIVMGREESIALRETHGKRQMNQVRRTLEPLKFQKEEEGRIRFFMTSGPDCQEELRIMETGVIPQIENISYIDFRQGIPPFTPTEPTTLSDALTQIDHCRPYFMAIIGHSYGWIPNTQDPNDISPSTIKQHPWLSTSALSTMELEIQYAMESKGCKSLFYVREGETVRSRMPSMNESVDQVPEEEETAARGRLEKLKIWIRGLADESHGEIQIREFTTIKEFEELVMADLRKWGLEAAPQHESQGDLPCWTAYARLLASSQTTPQPDLFTTLSDFAYESDSTTVLVVQGDAARRADACVAQWLLEGSHLADTQRAIHFVRPGEESGEAMIEGVAEQIGSQATSLQELVTGIPANIPTVIVIAGADRLPLSTTGSWLPNPLPSHVRMILTSNHENRQFDTMVRQHGWVVKDLPDPSPQERSDRVQSFISKLHTTAADKDAVAQVFTTSRQLAGKIDSPLFLSFLLANLNSRARTSSTTSDYSAATILRTHAARTLPSLIAATLPVLESLFSSDPLFNPSGSHSHHFTINTSQNAAPHPLATALVAIYASHNGISEADLRTLLGVSHRTWAAVHNTLVSCLVTPSGLHGRYIFTDPAIRAAVETRYAPTRRLQVGVKKTLAAFFATRFGKTGSMYSALEVSRGLIDAGDSVDLWVWLARPDVISTLTSSATNPTSRFMTLRSLWSSQPAGGPSEAKRIYTAIMNAPMPITTIGDLIHPTKDQSAPDPTFAALPFTYDSATRQILTDFLSSFASNSWPRPSDTTHTYQ
ncbi:hypothetical protein DFS34DRAFT_333499 [Phlyctochytrium arcticum]|nr:hypothetical protein DFS34DRAFT_333499 [Phlyctochytrium arcticum]